MTAIDAVSWRTLQLPSHLKLLRRGHLQPTPTILQMEALECGAASLAMVLAYYGRWVPLEELRLACAVSRDGSKASNILKAARRYGLAAKGFKKEPDQLTELPCPSILHWNFNHFVVFEGIHGDWAYLNDPAIGRRRITLAELSDAFTGVVLAFEPGTEFARGGRPPRALSLLWEQLGGAKAGLALVVLISVTLVIPGIVAPVFSKLLVDNVLVRGLSGWVGPLLIGLMLTALLRAVILLIRQHYLLRLEVTLGVTMATRLFWHVLRLPIAFFTQRHAGDIVYRLIVNEQVAKLLSGELATLMLHLVTIAFFAAVMAAYDLILAGIVVGFALVNLAILRLVDRRRDEASRRLSQGRGQLAAATAGAIRSIETIKSSGLELDAFARWAGYHAKATNASQDLDRQTAGLAAVPPLIGALTNAAVLGIGGLRVMHGVMSIGDLVAFQTLAASFSEPIGRLVGVGAKLPEVKADLIRVSDAMAYPTDPRTEGWDDTMSSAMPARLTGAIELRDVTFGYNPNEPPLISGFSLTVRPGQRIALVGGSGSGKSTVARLICGLYAPWSGDILFDGRPLAGIPPALFANSVAYVDQDISMFSGTVRDNVSLWDASVDEARVARALKDAAIFDEIALRPGLYEYKVAEGGLDFSGGQRQRLEIARALVGAPTILILDEATAALDPLVEEQIDANIRRRGCTCILVAHRYSTIRDCDEIVVLSNGQVEGRGTHAELLANCPHYADMLQAE